MYAKIASALRVATEPAAWSKSSTGSMMAQQRVRGSLTTYWTLPVTSS